MQASPVVDDLVQNDPELKVKTDALYEYLRNVRGFTYEIIDLHGIPYTDRLSTEEQVEFENTFKFLKKIAFTKIHTFPFSLRSGTKAEEMSEHFVDEKIKKERVKKVLELSRELENAYYKKFIGKTLSVIVEDTKDGISRGHTDNYILVNLDSKVPSGKMVDAKIYEVDNLNVKGNIIDIDKN